MILIVVPTLNLEQGREVGRRAQASAACDTRLVVIHDEEGIGFNKPAIRGMRQRKPGEDVALVNDDIYRFSYGWLKILSAALHADPRRGIVGPSGKSANSGRRNKIGEFGTRSEGMLPFWCVLIRCELLDQIGYMNEEFIHYSSDTLYCYLARSKGWKIEWIKSVFLWHQHAGSGFQQKWRDEDTVTFKRLMSSLRLRP